MYFAIIFANHVAALVLPLAYYPSVFTCCLAYGHLGMFISVVVNSICMDEKEAGKGGKTLLNRIFWVGNFEITKLCASLT